MKKATWLLATVLCGCGFGSPINVPASVLSGGTGDGGSLNCGAGPCDEDAVCVRIEPDETGGEPIEECVPVADCLVSPPDCTCIVAVCGEGQQCVQISFVPGEMFACQAPVEREQ
jgi:hypothetical protein